MTAPAEVIDWIEAELAMDDGNFRDVDVIIADARARFVGSTSSDSAKGTNV